MFLYKIVSKYFSYTQQKLFGLYQQYLSTFSKHGDFVDKKTLVSNKVSELKRRE